MRRRAEAAIGKLAVSCYKVPTDAPEADGAFDWKATTLVLVELTASECTGLGYTYADTAAGQVVQGASNQVVEGKDAFDRHAAMPRQVRNLGRACGRCLDEDPRAARSGCQGCPCCRCSTAASAVSTMPAACCVGPGG